MCFIFQMGKCNRFKHEDKIIQVNIRVCVQMENYPNEKPHVWVTKCVLCVNESL